MEGLLDNPMLVALAQRELQRREEERARARKVESSTSSQEESLRVREAIRSTSNWMRNYTKTNNPHWVEEGRPAPNEPFPDWFFFEPMLEMIEREKVSCFEKSRDLMATWAVVAYFTLQAQSVPHREIVFQSIDGPKAEQLIEYAKCLYEQQPTWLKEAMPLTKASAKQPVDSLSWANGSVIWSVPSGKDQIRSFHPWGYFSDESAFQPEAGLCLDSALGSGCQKLVFLSTANIGWFEDFTHDTIIV